MGVSTTTPDLSALRIALLRRFTWVTIIVQGILVGAVAVLPGSIGQALPLMTLGAAVAAAILVILAVRHALSSVVHCISTPRSRRGGFVRLRWFAVLGTLALAVQVAGLAAGVIAELGLQDLVRPMTLLLAGSGLLLLGTMLVPLFVYGYGILGRLLGRYLDELAVFPLGSRMLVLGLALPLLAASAIPAYLTWREGGLPVDVAVLWLLAMAYVAAVGSVAYRNQARSLRPLLALLDGGSGPHPVAEDDARAASLDQLGVGINRLRTLLAQRARTEHELSDSETRIRMFAEAASDYLYEIDEHLRFSYVSPRFEALTGIPAALVVGQSALELGHVQESPERLAHAADLRAHRPYRNHRFSVRTRDGRTLHLQVSALPYFDGQGNFLGYRGAGTDITEFVETQERLRQARYDAAMDVARTPGD
jgi:PAS domain S-box-containing protein